jgi:NADH-quinone oxidoreductase subunit I
MGDAHAHDHGHGHDDHGHGHGHDAHGHGHGEHALAEPQGVRVVKVKRTGRTAWKDAYLGEIVKGLGVTFRHFFKNLFRTGTPAKSNEAVETVDYPSIHPDPAKRRAEDEAYLKNHYPARYRGQHRLTHREDGRVRCTACMLCATACPAQCIKINAGEADDHHVEKFAVEYEIDYLKCIFCGFCVEACPCDAIRMDTGHHTPPFEARPGAVLGKVNLMQTFPSGSIAVHGGTHLSVKVDPFGHGGHTTDPVEVPLAAQPEGPTVGAPNSPSLRR